MTILILNFILVYNEYLNSTNGFALLSVEHGNESFWDMTRKTGIKPPINGVQPKGYCDILKGYLNQQHLEEIMQVMKFSIGTTLPNVYEGKEATIETKHQLDSFPSGRYFSFIEDEG